MADISHPFPELGSLNLVHWTTVSEKTLVCLKRDAKLMYTYNINKYGIHKPTGCFF